MSNAPNDAFIERNKVMICFVIHPLCIGSVFYFGVAMSLNCRTRAQALLQLTIKIIAQQFEFQGLDCLMEPYSFAT